MFIDFMFKKWLKSNWSLLLGIGAMFLLIAGTVVIQGTTLQKVLFLIGAPLLGVTAWSEDQKMLMFLQAVITISAVIAFFPDLALEVKFMGLFVPSVLGVIYLVKVDYIEKDSYWPVGAFGLLLIAAGLSVAGVFPFYFNLLLAIGGISVALYAFLGYYFLKVKIQLMWLILNVLFAVNPLIRVAAFLLGF